MLKSYFLIGALVVALVVGKPIDSDDEFFTGEPIDGSSLEAYRYDTNEAEAEPNTSSEEQTASLVKRELSTLTPDKKTENLDAVSKPTVSLSDLIGSVEEAIVHSASSIASFVKVHNNSDSSKDSTTAEPHTVNKRSAEITLTNDQPEPIFKYITARSVSATGDQPAHFAIDRVSVFNTDSGLTPLISSLDFHLPVQQTTSESSTKINDRENGQVSTTSSVPSSTASTILNPTVQGTSTSAVSLSVSSLSPVKLASSTPSAVETSTSGASTLQSSTPAEASSSTSSTTPTPTTTTKTPIEKLKEAEEDVKEKVAEIEAEPIILSARV